MPFLNTLTPGCSMSVVSALLDRPSVIVIKAEHGISPNAAPNVPIFPPSRAVVLVIVDGSFETRDHNNDTRFGIPPRFDGRWRPVLEMQPGRQNVKSSLGQLLPPTSSTIYSRSAPFRFFGAPRYAKTHIPSQSPFPLKHHHKLPQVLVGKVAITPNVSITVSWVA